jgi:hypothetical protein
MFVVVIFIRRSLGCAHVLYLLRSRPRDLRIKITVFSLNKNIKYIF